MIGNIKLFENIMNNKNHTYTSIANHLNIELTTLTSKVKRKSTFKFDETIKIANLLDMTHQEYLICFYDLHTNKENG